MTKPPFLRDTYPESVLTIPGMTIDCGRQRFTREDMEALYALGREKRLLESFNEMLQGKVVNESESRQALHTSLRSQDPASPHFKEVRAERERQCQLAQQIREGVWRGHSGQVIKTIINVGIGGSHTGIEMVYHALMRVTDPVRLFFVTAADGIQLSRVLGQCNPHETVVIVSSKSFSTRETRLNAGVIEQWFLDHGIEGKARRHHLLVVSANPEAPQRMLLPETNYFRMWEWVGGRFSVWSAVGLPLMIALGPDVFLALLAGAEHMDMHAATKPIEENAPARLALIAYANVMKHHMVSHCVLPYDERLRFMVPWLQQLEMESLGKRGPLDDQGRPAPTGQAVWGTHGNEAQHSFFQWLREGAFSSSIDLIWSDKAGHQYAEQYRVLLANAQAQAQALVESPAHRQAYNGLTTIELDEVSPFVLGNLMALYEHKTTMLGTLYQINPFDQPGVELGKALSRRLELGED